MSPRFWEAVYWKSPFEAFANTRQLEDFFVVDVRPTGVVNGKFQLGEAVVCLASEIGKGREWIVRTRTWQMFFRLATTALGYHVESLNYNNPYVGNYKGEQMPDVIIVRKILPK